MHLQQCMRRCPAALHLKGQHAAAGAAEKLLRQGVRGRARQPGVQNLVDLGHRNC